MEIILTIFWMIGILWVSGICTSKFLSEFLSHTIAYTCNNFIHHVSNNIFRPHIIGIGRQIKSII